MNSNQDLMLPLSKTASTQFMNLTRDLIDKRVTSQSKIQSIERLMCLPRKYSWD